MVRRIGISGCGLHRGSIVRAIKSLINAIIQLSMVINRICYHLMVGVTGLIW